MSLPDEVSRFERIHDDGIKRHPHSWFRCNVAAVNAINSAGGRPEDQKTKEIAADIVLRVLDVVGAP